MSSFGHFLSSIHLNNVFILKFPLFLTCLCGHLCSQTVGRFRSHSRTVGCSLSHYQATCHCLHCPFSSSLSVESWLYLCPDRLTRGVELAAPAPNLFLRLVIFPSSGFQPRLVVAPPMLLAPLPVRCEPENLYTDVQRGRCTPLCPRKCKTKGGPALHIYMCSDASLYIGAG